MNRVSTGPVERTIDRLQPNENRDWSRCPPLNDQLVLFRDLFTVLPQREWFQEWQR